MAQRTEVIITDDLNGGPADETVAFGLDGKGFEIDLSKANAATMRANFGPYVDAARTVGKVGRTVGPRLSRDRTAEADTAEARAWAKANGMHINDRGRVPMAVIKAWQDAGSPRGNHGGYSPAPPAPPAPSIPFTPPTATPAADGGGELPQRTRGGKRATIPTTAATTGTARRRGGGRRTTA